LEAEVRGSEAIGKATASASPNVASMILACHKQACTLFTISCIFTF